MNSKRMFVLVLAGLFAAGCAQETGAPMTDPATDAAAQAGASANAAATDAAAQASDEVAAANVAALVAKADPKMGKRQYILCQACHTVQSGAPNRVGPNLAGVVGRPAAQAPGFKYSAAMKDSGIVWNAAMLDKWLQGPATLVPGTTMVFGRIDDPQQRANLIAYLQQPE